MSELASTLFGCAGGDGGVVIGVVGVEYFRFSCVHEKRFDALKLMIEFWSDGILSVTLASSAPNVGMTPVFVPERK